MEDVEEHSAQVGYGDLLRFGSTVVKQQLTAGEGHRQIVGRDRNHTAVSFLKRQVVIVLRMA